MRLALNNKGHYTDYTSGYELYSKRNKKGKCLDKRTYNKIIRLYCESLADKFLQEGMIDLPKDFGSIMAASIRRKPKYLGDKFIGYGAKDWTTGLYDGKLFTFGIVYLPKRTKYKNTRCLGFVANRKLFKEAKALYKDDKWPVIDFKDEMI